MNDPSRKPFVITALELEARFIPAELEGRGLAYGLETAGLRCTRLPTDLGTRPISCLIMAGIAGALDPSLKVGDVVMDDAAGLIGASSSGSVSIIRGGIHTSNQFIADPGRKAELFRSTGALAVEMEHAIARNAAQEAGIPFIGVRAISDTARETVDPRVLSLTDDLGHPKPMAVAALLARSPGMVKELWRLNNQSRQAAKALAIAVRWVIEKLNSSAAAATRPAAR
jgi:Phosphorylase superfamily